VPVTKCALNMLQIGLRTASFESTISVALIAIKVLHMSDVDLDPICSNARDLAGCIIS
jgi:hypothetical protein